MTFSKILIANRGEIACRVIRTAKRLGLQSVAVFSDADRDALHVRMADEAIHIGPPQALQSYLRKDKIIEAAKRTNAQAIHPGYGFLSENYEFCTMCKENNLIFIGPPPNAIRDMGIKNLSKIIMHDANVPVIFGYHGDDQSEATLTTEAKKIGYPIMIKAVRGGGGKGMRIAFNEGEFLDKLNAAKSESRKSFNDEAVLLEKFIRRPRHVEVQVFGDMHKNYVYLFERDCSVQRRHQKIIEEAPAPGLDWSTRKKLGEAAVKAARAVGYVGAGTVEFIMDENQEFYFMEMNTRLQVEHPITEMITGTDLVEWQIKVAQGEVLPMKQDDIKLRGHAFEARIYAEEPENDFMPGSGRLSYLRTPPTGEDGKIRVETGVVEGDEVSVHYDPMIAKLVAWSSNRTSALQKLRHALQQYYVGGLKTNIPFLMSLCDNAQFQLGNVHTDFIKENRDALFHVQQITPTLAVAAASTYIQSQLGLKYNTDGAPSFFATHNNSFRLNFQQNESLTLIYDNQNYQFQIERISNSNLLVTYDNKTYPVEIRSSTDEVVLLIDGHQFRCRVHIDGDTCTFYSNVSRASLDFKLQQPSFLAQIASSGLGAAAGDPVAPMPGLIDKILVEEGTAVTKGQPLLIMTAMKMEHVIKASKDGIVAKVNATVGKVAKKGEILLTFVADDKK
ncbi:unnamed protein product [Rotaria magnacalcarata]|uniref:Methylcrotonoyl-CoA carboxylase subunit alpha, mitochondrial n=1 Tax=Rotaria magnacalcarata TaxID=392030 RepID=A0A819AZN1_9BILA|nr:unnamed protein product [Rotaria magnacalcarata]CAF3788321.1 unnamed protein product [Rotaria magnacalcarata]